MRNVELLQSVLAARDQLGVSVLKYLSDQSLRRAKDMTQHIVTLSIITLPDTLSEAQIDAVRGLLSVSVYDSLRRKKLICTEGRYKHCPKFTQFRITDDGLKFLADYDRGLVPSLRSWNPAQKS